MQKCTVVVDRSGQWKNVVRLTPGKVISTKLKKTVQWINKVPNWSTDYDFVLKSLSIMTTTTHFFTKRINPTCQLGNVKCLSDQWFASPSIKPVSEVIDVNN